MLIAGNWKMNMDRASAKELVRAIIPTAEAMPDNAKMVVFPPAVLIDTVVSSCGDSGLLVGGQDCHQQAAGAHTGDLSADLLVDAGCRWVLTGHSERRTDHGESNADVAAKTAAALQAGLNVIICVGETLDERQSGAANDLIAQQILGSLPENIPHDRFAIAYEPVWAIGTGQVAKPDDVAAMHDHIRDILLSRQADYTDVDILYGGSVKPDNAADLLALDHVGGVLVGSASLNADDFNAIANAI